MSLGMWTTRACSGNMELPCTVQVRRVLVAMKLSTLRATRGQGAQAQLARARGGQFSVRKGPQMLSATYKQCTLMVLFVQGLFFYLLEDDNFVFLWETIPPECWLCDLVALIVVPYPYHVQGQSRDQAWRMSIFHLLDHGDWFRDQRCWT